MKPGMAGNFDAVGQQRVMRMVTPAAAETEPWHRGDGIPVQPFRDAAREGVLLRLRARQRRIEFGDARTRFEEDRVEEK
jgi:hypothetical protein